MTDLTRKFPTIPIIGGKDVNPFEPPTDAWLRDVTAAQFGVSIRTAADLQAILGDEKYFCDMCGLQFQMWPIRPWAAHYVHDHHDEITLQQIGGVSALLTDELTPGVQQWFGMQLMSRVSIRRRCHELGLIKWLPAGRNQRSD